SFRPGQEAIIANILGGSDTLGIMPTGGGKSICYQIPALMLPGLTLVISPLISLMKDQVDALNELGIAAAFINSTLSGREVAQRMNSAREGELKLLYIAPERLDSDLFLHELQALNVSMIAIDEAHCISQWGHDFRTSYLAIPRLLDQLPVRPRITAFTATATPEVTRDILHLLHIDPNHVFLTGFNRENLTFSILRGVNKQDFLDDFLRQHQEHAGIVYCATRKEVDAVCTHLQNRGFAAGKYHAGLSDEEKTRAQEQFLYDDLRVLVATNAFGMGIDKSNVRFVIHHNMPKNMESYYQEAGRAGRDGEPSSCYLLYHPQDVLVQKFLIEQSTNEERKGQEYKKLQAMVDFCHTTRCLRNYILDYFEDQPMEPCGRCSNCVDDSELHDITVEAQKIFSCVRRMKERFGVTLVAQVLKGSANKKVKQFGFDKLPTYGLMKDYKEKEIVDLMHVLTAEGYLTLTEGKFPVVQLSQQAVPVLQGQTTVMQKVRMVQEAAARPDADLFGRLRELRKVISQQEKVPPYIIFADSTLREMSERCPLDAVAMLQIKGVGEAKFRKYGESFLELLQEYAKEKGMAVPESEGGEVMSLVGADGAVFDTADASTAGTEGRNGSIEPHANPDTGTFNATNALVSASASTSSQGNSTTSASDTPSHILTYELFHSGVLIEDVATERGLHIRTVQEHIIRAASEGYEMQWERIIPVEHELLILQVIDELGAEKLKPLKEALPREVDYFAIKAVLCKRSLEPLVSESK
ncbi:MAG TPA: DNA helicase RecQ, partial [Bacilli bacterium]|nr:DNA helicase RecQ [Bacilli bacterium]